MTTLAEFLKVEGQELRAKAPEREPILHDNIRGSQYYH